MKQILLLLGAIFIITQAAYAAPMNTWEWTDGNGNLHTYTVEFGNYTWDSAWGAMTGEYGTDAYLATITSQSEQDAMNLALDSFNLSGEFWLGAEQESNPGYAADEGWTWVTGETFSFTSWLPGEPNDWNNTLEDHLGIRSTSNGWGWNDEHGSANIVGYIVETGTLYANPEPTTMLLFGCGLICIAGIGRKKYKS